MEFEDQILKSEEHGIKMIGKVSKLPIAGDMNPTNTGTIELISKKEYYASQYGNGYIRHFKEDKEIKKWFIKLDYNLKDIVIFDGWIYIALDTDILRYELSKLKDLDDNQGSLPLNYFFKRRSASVLMSYGKILRTGSEDQKILGVELGTSLLFYSGMENQEFYKKIRFGNTIRIYEFFDKKYLAIMGEIPNIHFFKCRELNGRVKLKKLNIIQLKSEGSLNEASFCISEDFKYIFAYHFSSVLEIFVLKRQNRIFKKVKSSIIEQFNEPNPNKISFCGYIGEKAIFNIIGRGNNADIKTFLYDIKKNDIIYLRELDTGTGDSYLYDPENFENRVYAVGYSGKKIEISYEMI